MLNWKLQAREERIDLHDTSGSRRREVPVNVWAALDLFRLIRNCYPGRGQSSQQKPGKCSSILSLKGYNLAFAEASSVSKSESAGGKERLKTTDASSHHWLFDEPGLTEPEVRGYLGGLKGPAPNSSLI